MDHRFDVQASANSHFAWLRTRMALERTLMAWVRTGASLIGFGFTIVSFFEKLEGMGRDQAVPRALKQVNLSHGFGQGLILAGVAALIISTWQYEIMIRYLWSDQYLPIAGVEGHHKRTPLLAVALFLILVGVFALVAVNLRLR